MPKPGRKSKTDLALANVNATERPGPVAGMTDEQQFEWVRIVNSCEAERFTPDLLPLLEAYCRHRVALRRVGDLVAQAEADEEFNIVKYDRVLKMQEREGRALASLAVRLGFAKTAGPQPGGKGKANSAPWE